MSYGVACTQSEQQEVLDILMPLPKRQKIHHMSLYQISKFSLSLDVGDITQELKERWSQPISTPSIGLLSTYLQQALTAEEKIPISQKHFDQLCVAYSRESS